MKPEPVYKVVSSIPKGKVLTYKALAKLSGVGNPRVVGNILHKNPDPVNIPCHRVVNREGRVSNSYAFGGVRVQAAKLESEGVEVTNGKVDLSKYLFEI